MASIRAAAAAQTFYNPQIQPQASTQVGPMNDGVQPMDNIAYVNGVTEQYYQKVNALKSFMQDAHNNLGIDVRVPDASRPESIKLNTIFRNALSDILSQGTLLHNSQSMQMARESRGVINQGGYNPTETPAASATPGQDFVERPLEQWVSETNNLTQTPSYDEREYQQKLKVYNDTLKRIDSQIAADPSQRARLEYQKQALTPPAQRPFRPYNDTYQDRRAGKREQNAELALKELINVKHGYAVGFQPSTKTAPSGELYEYNANYQNIPYGKSGKTIQTIRRDPGTSKVEIVFTDGTTQDMSKTNVSVIAAQLGSQFGFGGEDLQSYIDKHDLEGERGALREDWALPSGERNIKVDRKGKTELISRQEQIREEQQAARTNKKALVEPIANAILDKAKNVDTPFLFSNDLNIDLGNGRKIALEKNRNGKWTVSNLQELFPQSMFADKKNKIDSGKRDQFYNKFKDSSLTDIVKQLLNNLNVDDFGTIYEALGIPVPAEFGGQGQSAAPAQSVPQGNNDPLGIR